MPELLEVEMYRRSAESLLGRTISDLHTPDEWYLKGVDRFTLCQTLIGAEVESIGRVGKLLLVETTSATIGLRFGMTGILLVDDKPVIAELEYSSKRMDPAWNRFGAQLEDGGLFVMNDPRRLGGVELDPDLTRLGADAWSIDHHSVTELFERYTVATKTLLLNQKRVAGLGNLLVDELLWRTGVSPLRSARQVGDEAVHSLANELHPMLDQLYQLGGSNCGDLFPERHVDGRCPIDGAALVHDTVGGRSTWWCPAHQL